MKGILLQMAAVPALAAVASAQVPAGGEFRVNTYTTNTQASSRAAMAPGGDFVVVWESYPQDGGGSGVFGQRFAASGASRGSEFQINTYTTGRQAEPHVAVGRRGDFAVVWASIQYASGQSIAGRRYDAAGNPTAPQFLVNTSTTDFDQFPHIGRAADGRFVASWTSFGLDGSDRGLAARRFGASGDPIGSEFVVNTYTTGAQGFGPIAVEANGNFVAVWVDYNDRDGSGTALFGQRYESSGNRLGSEFQVNSYTTGSQRAPSVSMSPAGGFVVAWTSQYGDGSGYGVFARLFDAPGNAAGSDFVVNTYTTGTQTTFFGGVAHDARGNFVVTWESSEQTVIASDVFVQRFDASGSRRGVEFRVNAFTPYLRLRPSVVSDSVGNFAVTWDSDGQDGGGWGVFAQRFGGLGPAALTVDSPGNRVLEPGETVDLRPTWRNFNGAAQTFSGTLTNIIGPAGATYTITDPTGNYGTVPNDTNAPCTDCYAVSVSNPATRPVVHWDAAAVESILPDALGQQKQWLLHVGRSFTDVPATNPFYRFVETLLHHGITAGCSPTTYCPLSATARQQMAVFVLVTKEGAGYVPPACTTPMFNDVPASSPFCRWIEELARRTVVVGCGGGFYCPTHPVSREQMAVFVLRTLDLAFVPPACTIPMYNDVPANSVFCPWVEELTRRNVVTGCGGGNFCPTTAVTREQNGVFISVTFGLTLYGP